MTKPKAKLTMEGLKAAMVPPNNCKVKEFRDTLPPGDQEILDTAVAAMDPREFSARALRTWIAKEGELDLDSLPGEDAWNDHKAGRKPCRCRG